MSDAVMTWAALLAKWTEFARAALALPKTAEGDRWRSAVPHIVSLQAITHALAELSTLDPAERAVALDRSSLMIRDHTAALNALWRAEPLPEALIELTSDASVALAARRSGGLEWVVIGDRLIVEHPAPLIEHLLEAGFKGDLYLPVPGVPLFPGSPAAFVHGHAGAPVDDSASDAVTEFLHSGGPGAVRKPARTAAMRQVYRQFDFGKGGLVRDLVVQAEAGVPGGQPLLVPAIISGVPQPVPLPMRRAGEVPDLPVVFEG